MNGRTILEYLLGALVFLIVGSLVLGAVLGQPVLLTYVETESMSPTLEPNDGFVAIPSVGESSYEPGDVVVFDAEVLHDGGLVTHRIVDETDEGYITQGDANPVTDQDGDEPPVRENQIEAHALDVGGIVVIPQLGVPVEALGSTLTWTQQTLAQTFGTRAFLGTQGLAYLLVLFGGITYLLSAIGDTTGNRVRARSTDRETQAVAPMQVIVLMAIVLVAILTASMVLPGGAHDFTIVSSATESDRPEVIERGTTDTATFIVPSNGPLPVVAVVEPRTDGVRVDETSQYIGPSSSHDFSIALEAPDETGTYVETIHEYRYLAFLPTDLILALHALHPWAPIVAINALVTGSFAVVSIGLIGLDPIRIRRDSRDIPLKTRLRRYFRR